MNDLGQDLRHAVRRLRRSPGFAGAAILALAAGIGANAALFSVLDVVLLRRLPFGQEDRLVWIWSTRPDRDRAFFSIPNFEDYRSACRSFERLGAFAPWAAQVTGDGETERIQGARLSPDGFRILGVGAALGRTLVPDDGGGRRVAVLTHALWTRRFGADRSVVGRDLVLNGEAYTMVGVLPPAFFLPNAEPGTEIFVPLSFEADPRRDRRGANFLRAFGRLAPGVTTQQAGAEMAAIAATLRERHPEENAGNLAPRVRSMREEVSGPWRAGLLLLSGAVGALLLIACANLAGLQLARGLGRHREIAVRGALGATRGRLLRLLLAESLVLAVLGGTLGLLCAAWGLPAILALCPSSLPRAGEIAMGGPTILFTLAATILAGIASGLGPAWKGSGALRPTLFGALRRSDTEPPASPAQAALVVAELAVSLVLLVGAGLFVKSLARVLDEDPGIRAAGVLSARLGLPPGYDTVEKVAALDDELESSLRALSEVKGVGLTSVLPITQVLSRADFTIAGRPPATPAETPSAQNRAVSAGYFAAMGIPLLAGRAFDDSDDVRSRPVAIVDATLVRRHFPESDPVGAHLRVDDGGGWRDVEIVGVVGAVKLAALEEESAPTLYVPFAQLPAAALGAFTSRVHLVVRGKSEEGARGLERGVWAAVQAVDRGVSLSGVRTMQDVLDAATARRRFERTLLGLFAGAAVLLAASGLYALIAGRVAARTREIGIRMALGARRGDVLREVVGHSAQLAAFGLGAGLLGALALSRAIASLLFEVRPDDPGILLLTTATLAIVAIAASLVPALRAARVDPAVALRAE